MEKEKANELPRKKKPRAKSKGGRKLPKPSIEKPKAKSKRSTSTYTDEDKSRLRLLTEKYSLPLLIGLTPIINHIEFKYGLWQHTGRLQIDFMSFQTSIYYILRNERSDGMSRIL